MDRGLLLFVIGVVLPIFVMLFLLWTGTLQHGSDIAAKIYFSIPGTSRTGPSLFS
jgi:hypothetical protein